MLTTRPQSAGFTLVELMIAIAIFAVTLTYGVSSFRAWIQNTQIRTAAESIQNGLQKARAEAVKRNANIAFTLGTNSSWQLGIVGSSGVIESRSGTDGSKNITISTSPAGATTITFSSLGAVIPNTPSSLATMNQVDVDSTALSAADSHNLRINIGLGGIVRMCDPNLTSGTSPQAC